MVSAATKERLRKLRQKFGLGEYKNKRTAKPKRTKSKRISRGGVSMAKRGRKSRSSGGMGGGKLMNGFFKPKGFLAAALIGAAAAEVSEAVAPQVIPYQNLAVAGIVGGLPGVVGSYALNMIQGKGTSIFGSSTKTSSVSGY